MTAEPAPLLHKIDDAVRILNLSRSVIYELIRAGRLRAVNEGRSSRITDTAIRDYIALLESEAA
jgi:excisionase family DNA binding protein